MIGLLLAAQLALASAPDPGLQVAGPAVGAATEQVTVQTRLSPETSNVGDLLTYEVIVAFPQGTTVNLPTQLDFSPLHLVETADSEIEATGSSLRKTFTITLQHFAPGEAAIPAFSLTTVDAAGAVETVSVPAKPFTVEALLANEVDPVRKGEDDPVSIEYPNDTAETAILAALGGAVLLALAWLAFRGFFRKPKVVPAPPPIPPHEVALCALEELENGELMERDDLVPFYLQLTEIAKGYLEGRFGVPSLDRTTEEIRRELVRRSDAIAPLSADEVVAFLQRSDLVKFARYAPEDDAASLAISEVREMVERSTAAAKPEPARQPAAGPGADSQEAGA
ncbi:MAG: hypothetical protein ACE37F_05215 [Nannocystaceae bacterium]|nr:hypothetical protein [bacterium]